MQVTADVSYTHTSETSETFDPDSKVVRSTQTVESNNSDTNPGGAGAVSVGSALPGAAAAPAGDGTKSNATRTEETTNYEINKAVKTSTVDGGTVKRLSVAVVVDGTQSAIGAYKPRSAAEMKQIEDLVKSAIGYDVKRGDIVQVDNMAFARLDAGDGAPAPAPLLGLDGADWFKIIEAAILSLTALLIGFFVARPLIARMFAPITVTTAHSSSPVVGQLASPSQAQTQPSSADGQPLAIPAPHRASIDVSQIEGHVRESSIKKVGEVVNAHPEEALAIIRTWLHEPA